MLSTEPNSNIETTSQVAQEAIMAQNTTEQPQVAAKAAKAPISNGKTGYVEFFAPMTTALVNSIKSDTNIVLKIMAFATSILTAIADIALDCTIAYPFIVETFKQKKFTDVTSQQKQLKFAQDQLKAAKENMLKAAENYAAKTIKSFKKDITFAEAAKIIGKDYNDLKSHYTTSDQREVADLLSMPYLDILVDLQVKEIVDVFLSDDMIMEKEDLYLNVDLISEEFNLDPSLILNRIKAEIGNAIENSEDVYLQKQSKKYAEMYNVEIGQIHKKEDEQIEKLNNLTNSLDNELLSLNTAKEMILNDLQALNSKSVFSSFEQNLENFDLDAADQSLNAEPLEQTVKIIKKINDKKQELSVVNKRIAEIESQRFELRADLNTIEDSYSEVDGKIEKILSTEYQFLRECIIISQEYKEETTDEIEIESEEMYEIEEKPRNIFGRIADSVSNLFSKKEEAIEIPLEVVETASTGSVDQELPASSIEEIVEDEHKMVDLDYSDEEIANVSAEINSMNDVILKLQHAIKEANNPKEKAALMQELLAWEIALDNFDKKN